MVVISYGTLRTFIDQHAGSRDALNNWYRFVSRANWKNFHDMKSMYNSADAVGNYRYVFNIRGNSCRLVALIFFDVRTVYIRFIGTHADYDKIDCTTI